jgi:hypothetical protein
LRVIERIGVGAVVAVRANPDLVPDVGHETELPRFARSALNVDRASKLVAERRMQRRALDAERQAVALGFEYALAVDALVGGVAIALRGRLDDASLAALTAAAVGLAGRSAAW